MNNPEWISEQLVQLRLPFFREHYQSLADEAAREQWTHLDYLNRLIEGETQKRQERSIARRISAARFPVESCSQSRLSMSRLKIVHFPHPALRWKSRDGRKGPEFAGLEHPFERRLRDAKRSGGIAIVG